MTDKIQKSEADWKKELSPEAYHILRQGGTEAPYSGELLYNEAAGMYRCAACGNALFSSQTKFESKTPGLVGWPAFSEAVQSEAVELLADNSLGMQRTEVRCKKCGSHLGHLFADESVANGKHFCINSTCLRFEPK